MSAPGVPYQSRASTAYQEFCTTEEAIADRELVAKSLQGDQEAFANLYERYFDRIHDFVLRMLGDPAEAADVAQDTFMKLLPGQGTQPPEVSFRAWLYTIAHHKAIDKIRKGRRQTRMPSTENEEGEELPFDQVATSPEDNPEQAAIKNDIAALVWQAARGLNPQEYSLLDLHLRQGLEPEELAQALGTSRGNVYTKLSRLRNSMEEAVTTLLLARHKQGQCPELNALLLHSTAAEELTPRVRRAIARHTESCATCQSDRRRYASAAELFGGLVPVLPIPAVKASVFANLLGNFKAAGGPTGLGSHGPGPSGAEPVSAPAATTVKTGFWASLNLPTKAALVSMVGVITILAVPLAAMFVWGSAQVWVENLNCPPVEIPAIPLSGIANALPILEIPKGPINAGEAAPFRVPAGKVDVGVSSSQAVIRGFGQEMGIFFSSLASAEWDGQELVGARETLKLARGSTHTLRLVCEGG